MKPDVVLGLESTDFFDTVRPLVQGGNPPKLITITAGDLFRKANYQDNMRFRDVDLGIAADAEATLPDLIEACKRLITRGSQAILSKRAAPSSPKPAGRLWKSIAPTRPTDGTPAPSAPPDCRWNCMRRSRTRIGRCVTESFWIREWPLRLWDFNKHYQYIGGAGGEGVGYQAPAAIGAALANKKHGRLSVAIQPDGDLMIANGCLWTAARHHIPLLMLMHNNRAYHQELMEIQSTAAHRSRGIDRVNICAKIDNPNIDYAKLAQSMGVRAEGPLNDPKELAAAIRRGHRSGQER